MVTTCFSKIRRATCTVYINWHLLTTFIFIPSLLVSNCYHVVYLRFPSPFWTNYSNPACLFEFILFQFAKSNLFLQEMTRFWWIQFLWKFQLLCWNEIFTCIFYSNIKHFLQQHKTFFLNYRLIRKGSVKL